MDNDKETEKTEETKLRDLTPEKDAKGGRLGLQSTATDQVRQDIAKPLASALSTAPTKE